MADALIELAEVKHTQIELGAGESRSFLEDGDAVLMTGWCERPGFAPIGFGENRAEALPAQWE